jgi:hypothetical protein
MGRHQRRFVASFLQAVRSRVCVGEGTSVFHSGGFGAHQVASGLKRLGLPWFRGHEFAPFEERSR